MQYGRGAVSAVAGALVLIALGATPARAVVQAQVDDFENGTTQNWRGGPLIGNPNPNPPTNVTSGGPAGANDNYMLVRSTGIGTSGSKLVAFNSDQWAGDYIDADIDAVQMQVNNFGATSLRLWLVLTDEPNGQGVSTISSVDLPAGSGWRTVTFSLAQPNLTGEPYATVMSNVVELNLVHYLPDAQNPITLVSRNQSTAVAAQLGVDNVTALPVPEPAFAGVAIAGTVAAMMRRGRRRASRARVDVM